MSRRGRRRRGGRGALRYGTLHGTIVMFVVATTFLLVSIIGRFYFFRGGPSTYMQVPFYVTAVMFYSLSLMSYMRYRKNIVNGGNQVQCENVNSSRVSVARSHISNHTVSANFTMNSTNQQREHWEQNSNMASHGYHQGGMHPAPMNYPIGHSNYQQSNSMVSPLIPSQHLNR